MDVTIGEGLVLAACSAAVTLFGVSIAALLIVCLRIQEERAGKDSRSAGCRRMRPCKGCEIELRVAEPARGVSNWRE